MNHFKFAGSVALFAVMVGCGGPVDGGSASTIIPSTDGASDSMTPKGDAGTPNLIVNYAGALSAPTGDIDLLKTAVAEFNACNGPQITFTTDAPLNQPGKVVTFLAETVDSNRYNIYPEHYGTFEWMQVDYFSSYYNYQVFLRGIAEGFGVKPSDSGIMAPMTYPNGYNNPGHLDAVDCAAFIGAVQ